MENISESAVSRREAARNKGKFGFQQLSEAAGGTDALQPGSGAFTIDPGVNNPYVAELAGAGLSGRVEACNLQDPDLPKDAVVFYPEGGTYGMVLGNLGGRDFTVWDDLDDTEAWRNESGEEWSAAAAAKHIRDTSFEREARDELYAPFSNSDEYELRNSGFYKGNNGEIMGSLTFSDNEGTGYDAYVDLGSGEVTVKSDEGQTVDPETFMKDVCAEDHGQEYALDAFRSAATELARRGYLEQLSK